MRLRPESFADHYSQARQFFVSQTAPEQRHIVDALTFELSKCENPVIRERMVAHLLNIDETLGTAVADKLGLEDLPTPADAAIAPRDDLDPSPALSIIGNSPKSFEGRKVGVLVGDGADASVIDSLRSALEAEGATMEIVAPKIAGVEASDGTWVEAKHTLDGGPSVLFDAVAIVAPEQAAERLAGQSAARDFVADAYAHCKFIAFVPSTALLFVRAGVEPGSDEGLIAIEDEESIASFVDTCRNLRLWSREQAVKG